MSRVTDRNAQMVRFLNRMFLPSTPQPTTPGDIDEVIHLYEPVLPPELLYERAAYQAGATVNPATQLFWPSVENGDVPGPTALAVAAGKFYLLLAASWIQATALSTVTGNAQIALRLVAAAAGDEFPIAKGSFITTNFEHLSTLAPQIGAAGGVMIGGGVLQPVVVPPGYCIHFSTGATPAATTTYRALVHYVVCDLGELMPNHP